MELTQQEIDQLSPEEYSSFLAFGDKNVFKLDEESYEHYLLSYREFDL